MANPLRGEASLEVVRAGTARPYTFRSTTNIVCALEKRTGKSFGQILVGCVSADESTLRDLLFQLLQAYHAKEFKTLESVGDFIDDAGGPDAFASVFSAIYQLNKPPADVEQESAGESRPNEPAPAGTGDASASTRADASAA